MVISASTKQFQNLIEEEYVKLTEKRRLYYLTVYEKLSKSRKDDPLVNRFFNLIHKDIQSLELLTLAYKLSNN
jgi:hypothetical protein